MTRTSDANTEPRWLDRLTQPLKAGLFVQVVVATILALILGLVAPGIASEMNWASALFMRLIVMVVGPLLFCIIVLGIAQAGSLGQVGRLGGKALLYFEVMTTIALLAALAAAWVIRPGAGIAWQPSPEDTHAVAGFVAHASSLHDQGISGFLLGIIPKTPVSAFADGNVLQILFISILTGCCLSRLETRGQPIVTLIEALNGLFTTMMSLIIRLAPLGVFGAIATTTARYGIGAIMQLAGFVVLYFAAIGVFVLMALGACLMASGVSPLRFWRYLREELLITATTTSSDAVLPSIMAKLEAMGVDRQVVGLVVPAGYSFNLDALSIYLGFAVLFLAQATHAVIGVEQLLAILATALITSKGAHGVPGIAIVILAATLAAAPAIPSASIVLLLSVDWFIGIARAIGNLCGNCVAPVVIAAHEGRLDRDRMRAVLNDV